ncbi:MAG: hypothetical protein ACYS9C_11365 [Planctomycetota bacterium]|jgi:hypothetical protein
MYEKKRAINTISIIAAVTTFASTFFQNFLIFSKFFLLSGNLPFKPYCSVTGEMMGVILSAAKNLGNESLISFRKPDASLSAQHDHTSNHT